LVIFEIQQNSDTTYRAFDWNRVDIDGKPRCLHIAESLASIDFNDFEPALVSNRYERIGQLKSRRLVDHELFNAQLLHSDTTQSFVRPNGKLNIFGCTTGRLTIISETLSVQLEKGGFALIPSAISVEVRIEPGTSFVMVQPGE
jgi:mannose-6-phosphate isomerase